MEQDLYVHIDLHNLEDSKFEGSKYVLTSPRSLEACSRLDVKPIELLYRPLSEFQEELLPQDVPLRTIYSLFDESEQIRQQKLKLCREEHSHITENEEKERSKSVRKAALSTLPSEDYNRSRGKVQRKKTTMISSTSPVGYRNDIKTRSLGRSVKESFKLHRELVSKKEKNPARPKSVLKVQTKSARRKKSQRCSPSVAFGSKINVRTNSVPNLVIKMPERDEKILKLMRERREEEKKSISEKQQVHRLWEDQKKREEALRTIAENKRRQLLAEENRIVALRKAEEDERRARAEEQELELKKLSLEESQMKANLVRMKQLQIREHELSDKINKDSARWRIQQQNMRVKEIKDEHAQLSISEKQKFDLVSASERKDFKLHQDTLKKFYDNRRERELYERRQTLLQNQEKQNNDLMKSSIDLRMSQAETNLSMMLGQKNQQLEQLRREEELKQHKAKTTSQKLEAEMEQWHQELVRHKKMLENRASEVVNHSIEFKSYKARKNRVTRQMEQKKKMSKINKEDQKWRRSLELSLVEKDRKIEDLVDEKEKMVAQTRAMAQLTQTMRDDIKERYLSDTFDKKVLEAQLHCNLNNNSRHKAPSLKNRSSMKIC